MAFGVSVFYNTLMNFLLFLLSPQMVMYFLNLPVFQIPPGIREKGGSHSVFFQLLKTSTGNKMSAFSVYR